MTKEFDFDALWCYIWAECKVSDDKAKRIAELCTSEGVTTWRQWSELDEVEQACFVAEVLLVEAV